MGDKSSVGYKKPPQHTRFKKGQSGNPKGRPKGAKGGIYSIVKNVMNKNIVLQDGSNISKLEATITQVFNKASLGDAKYAKIAINLAEKCKKQELSSLFLCKMIYDGFIDEESVEEYVNSKESLYLKNPPKAIKDMFQHQDRLNIAAFESVKYVTLLANIYAKYNIMRAIDGIYKMLSIEYEFWKGIETTLDMLGVIGEEREAIIQEHSKTREYEKPSERLYKIGVKLYIKSLIPLNNLLVHSREALSSQEYYKEQEKVFFSQEYKEELLEQAKQEPEAIDYDSLKAYLEEREKLYKEYFEVISLSEDIICTKDITEEDVKELCDWYMVESPYNQE